MRPTRENPANRGVPNLWDTALETAEKSNTTYMVTLLREHDTGRLSSLALRLDLPRVNVGVRHCPQSFPLEHRFQPSRAPAVTGTCERYVSGILKHRGLPDPALIGDSSHSESFAGSGRAEE